jgi:hypothetical protein
MPPTTVMDANAAKAVWLLGSGFSAPLGGPLLSDLFRQETEDEILPFFPDGEDGYPGLADALVWVQNTFRLGLEKGIWRNAEQYLAYVDDGYRGGHIPKRTRLAKLIEDADRRVEPYSGTPENIRQRIDTRNNVTSAFDRLVKRGLASEVSRFLIQNQPSSEAWLPYRNWVVSLRVGFDTVISFNYDTVIETAAEAAGVEDKFWFAVPNGRTPENKVPVLRLHGSVRWRLRPDPNDSSRRVVEPADVDLLRSPAEDIAIAAPGGSKSDFVGTHFQTLWSKAEKALSTADMLFVVGYGFPDTDPMAQNRLLGAFAAKGGGERAAHIVLGPDTTPVTRRMLSLVRSTARGRSVHVSEATRWRGPGDYFNIVQHPLWAQDFIGRFDEYTTSVTQI